MHIILGIIAAATAFYFIVIRARHGAEVATELLDVADDIRAAARRFAFRRGKNQHPVDSIEDSRLAIAGLATAFIALDDLPTAEARTALDLNLRKTLNLSAEEAQELEVLGQWFVSECGTPLQSVPRLSKKLQKLGDGAENFERLMSILGALASHQPGGLSTRQSEALEDIKHAFRLT